MFLLILIVAKKIMIKTANKDTNSILLTGGKEGCYSLNSNVFLFLQNGLAQILDLNRGKFYGLDPISTSIVLMVLEKNLEEVVASITETYAVSEGRIRDDINQLLRRLERNKLLVGTTKSSKPLLQKLRYRTTKFIEKVGHFCRSRLTAISHTFSYRNGLFCQETSSVTEPPSRHTIELLLTLSWLSFRILGWSRTISIWSRWHYRVPSLNSSISNEVLQEIDQAICEAAAWKLFLPMVCKERALVGFHILRALYGLPATLVIGIASYPFRLHAWVECNGTIITDCAAHCKPFTTVVRYS